MVQALPTLTVLTIRPFHISIGLFLFLRITKVNKEPIRVSVIMLSIFEKVRVTLCFHISVCVSGKVKYASTSGTKPKGQGAVTKKTIR